MLQWIDIHHRYGSKVLADGLSLDVAGGEVVAILGASGSGKSTLLSMAAGLLRPQRGQVWFDGKDYTDKPAHQRRFALMFQDYALLPHLNVWQNVAFGLKMQGVATLAARHAASAMLQEVGLKAEAERSVQALSGGEKQRVALARALVSQPRALLLDEPFSALDSGLRHQLQQLTLSLLKRQACPSVLVTHSPQEAMALATRVCLLHQGRWLQQGTAATLTAKPASAAAARLLGLDNVRSEVYIPNQALHIHHAMGEPSVLLSAVPQAGLWRLGWQHPRYGELWQWLAPGSVPSLMPGEQARLWVDERALVRFDQALRDETSGKD